MVLLAKIALGVSTTLALTTALVFREGVIRVDVDENRADGSHVHLWVPATAVSAGLRLTPRRHLQQAAAQARPYLPVMREVSKELQRYSNAELVDVKTGSEHVRISVRAGKLYIDAVTDQENIHVSVPAETIGDVADRLEDVAPGI